DLVFASQTVRDHLELQLSDRAEQQRVVPCAFEDLDRPFLAQLLETFLELLGLERIARSGDAEELRGEVGNALERQRLPLGQCVADLQLAVIVNADEVTGDGILAGNAL